MKILLFTLLTTSLGTLYAQSSIIYAEWFIDQDPGFGQATPFANFSMGAFIEADAQIPLSDLTPGVHQWHARVKDSEQRWSQTLSRTFLVLPEDIPSPIAYAEWFWDTDPGYGQANAIAVVSGDTIQANWNIDLENLPVGIHDLQVRVQNNDGVWSQTIYRSTVIRAESEAMIEKINYYYTDPSGQTATYTYSLAQPQHFVELDFEPDSGDLMNGQTYNLCLTVIRTDGEVSFERCSPFTWSIPVGTQEDTFLDTFDLFPNPNDGNFKISLSENRSDVVYLRLVDALGRSAYYQKIMPYEKPEINIRLSQKDTGIYFVILETGNSLKIKKVIVR